MPKSTPTEIRALMANLSHGNQRLSLECPQKRQSLSPLAVSTSLLKRVTELCSPATSIYFSALTSEIHHATNTGNIRHFTTLLKSGDPATLPFGTGHAPVKSVDVV